ncbi:ABC transporter ATP-binding protein [Flavobacteriales bacterium]|nr:ABC transporter ATP-binding protein [Flavobacteriales bacterium]
MEFLLEVKDVVKRYGNHTALNEVSLGVPQGQIFGLLGPNGAGKTTLIRIINQITGPDSGTVLFDGAPLSPEHIQSIGYLPEERGLYKKMAVGDQVLYLARLKGMDKYEAKNKLQYWFEKFEIEDWWDKKVEELSKGMQQKIQFITTVLHEPKLLILDEPFSGFDPINTNLIKKEILELKEKGATIIFSTHNMSSVEEICDSIALINKSKKILGGSINEVRKTYSSNLFEIRFKGNMIAFTNALWTGYELIDQREDGPYITAKIKRLTQHSTNDLLNAIIPHVEVISLNEILPSMNDIFIEKVNEINQNLAHINDEQD